MTLAELETLPEKIWVVYDFTHAIPQEGHRTVEHLGVYEYVKVYRHLYNDFMFRFEGKFIEADDLSEVQIKAAINGIRLFKETPIYAVKYESQVHYIKEQCDFNWLETVEEDED